MLSAYHGMASTAKQLCALGAMVDNAQISDGCNALIMSASAANLKDSPELISTLVRYGAVVNARQLDGQTALMVAACNGNTGAVKALIDLKADLKACARNGSTALFVAAAGGHNETIKALLKDGKEEIVNLTIQNGEHPYLLEHCGYQINLLQSFGSGVTALMISAFKNHVSTVKTLIEFHAKVDSVTEFGHTAVSLAARQGHLDTVHCLKQMNANLYCQDGTGATPFLSAAMFGHTEMVKFLAGIDSKFVSAAMKNGTTALMMTAMNGYVNTLHALVELKADVAATIPIVDDRLALKVMRTALVNNQHVSILDNITAAYGEGVNALMLAAYQGQDKAVNALIRANADVNAETKEGWTALMLAVQNNREPVAKVLVDHNAKVMASTVDSITVFNLAQNNVNPGLVDLIRQNQAKEQTPESNSSGESSYAEQGDGTPGTDQPEDQD